MAAEECAGLTAIGDISPLGHDHNHTTGWELQTPDHMAKDGGTLSMLLRHSSRSKAVLSYILAQPSSAHFQQHSALLVSDATNGMVTAFTNSWQGYRQAEPLPVSKPFMCMGRCTTYR